MSGCLPSESKHPAKKPEKTKVFSLGAGAGASDVYTKNKTRSKQWTVTWQSLSLQLTQKGPRSAEMQKVTAQIYNDKYAGSTVTADKGQATNEDRQLELTGNVVVTSSDGKSTLKCDRLRYVAASHRFYASGNVRFKNSVASLGTFSQLVANANLTKVATPEDFHQ